MKTINLDKMFNDECRTVKGWKERGLIAEYRINYGTQSIWVRPEPQDDLGIYWNPHHILDREMPYNNA